MKMKNELESVCHKFGSVQVGYGFECVKHDGKAYAGNIVKVAAYPRGTLVTIEFFDKSDRPEGMYSVGESQASYRSVYLEDCETWWVYVYNRETVS